MIKKILTFVIVMAFINACEDFNGTATFPDFVQWESSSASIDENATEPISVEVQLVGAQKSSATEVTFDVTENGVTEGVDYSFPNGKTLSIAANASTATLLIAAIDNDGFSPDPRSITLTLTSAGNNLGTGGETAPNKSIVVSFVEDDCPVPSLEGTYNVVTTQTSPAGCDGVENSITITVKDASTYTLSDVTGGLYLNCYGADDNPGDITIDGFAISLTDQPDVVYGGDVFNGTGLIDCDGSFTLTWSNGFGDAGTSRFTK